MRDGSFSIITPPVLEMTPLGPVIIEGHTRAFYTAQLRRDRFRGVIVRDVCAPVGHKASVFEMRIAEAL
jgi:hypothetical protein